MNSAWWVPVLGLVGAAIAFGFFLVVKKQPRGDGKVRTIADAIHLGAMVFLRQEYTYLAVVVAIGFVVLLIFMNLLAATAFVGGAVSSALCGFIGMQTATRANERTAIAARDLGTAAALKVSFLSGSVMGLTVASVGLIGLGTVFALLSDVIENLTVLTGFGMGASLVALFARVGGGIYTKAADVGADLVGKVEAGIPEDDPRNPGVIADNVGDNVGDVAGMGADIFESYCSAIIGAVAIAATLSASSADRYGGRAALLVLPFALSAAGLVVSLISIGVVQLFVARSPTVALQSGIVSGAALFTGAAWIVVNQMQVSSGLWVAALSGTIGGVVIGLTTEFFTAGRPVHRIARSGETGAATVIISGLAVGMQSLVAPVLVLCGVIMAATYFGGLYGVAIAAVGMLATVGIVLAADAYGPIADNAGGIAEMAGMGEATRNITDSLDEVGNTTAAIGKGFAIGASALAALAVTSAYVETVSRHTPDFSLDITNPQVLIGMFIGGLLPFLFSAMTMTAVGDAASTMVEEIRRQFREIPGLLAGTAEPDHARCTEIATKAALKKMQLPAILTIAAPLLVGFGLGTHALGGLLGGSLLSGVLLAVFMSNAGAAWDNAKKYVESGHLGGKGSDVHKACVVGDTVGDPFKDTSGPSLNILIKVLAMVSLAIAPMLG